ncbi:MAG: hypothetical protein QXX94_02910 [Candidatus Bathyarchaeia archaeon]
MVRPDPLNPWHYRFFRRHIEAVAGRPYCRHGPTETDLEEGKCPSCGKPIRKDKT